MCAQPAGAPVPVPVVAEDPFAPLAPAAPTPAQADAHPDGKLDIVAMRESVRDVLVAETPTGPAGTVFAAAPTPELQRFKNRFDDGKRGWCLTAFQGLGVLALVAMPLAALLDKKDHGCKW